MMYQEKEFIRSKVFESLIESNFNEEFKNHISNIAINFKELYPQVDLDNVYKALKYNKGLVIDEKKLKPWWAASYSSAYINTFGQLEKGSINYRRVSDIDFNNIYSSETFNHEMLHSFGQYEYINNNYYYFYSGFPFLNINELFTDFYALKITEKMFGEKVSLDNLYYYDFGDSVNQKARTPGYSFFTFYGNLLDYMYGKEICSDTFNHTSYIRSNYTLCNLFQKFDESLKNINERQSADNYKKAEKALSMMSSYYLKENIQKMTLKDYIEFRELYIESMPTINNETITIETIESFDKFYFLNKVGSNINSETFKVFKFKLNLIEGGFLNIDNINDVEVDIRHKGDNIYTYFKIKGKNDVNVFIEDKFGNCIDLVPLDKYPDDLNFKKLIDYKEKEKTIFSKFRHKKDFGKQEISEQSFDEVLSFDAFNTLDVRKSSNRKNYLFKCDTIDYAFNKNLKRDISDFNLRLEKNFKDSTGKNISYLLLKGIHNDEDVCVYLSNFGCSKDFNQNIDVFFEKDNIGKSFIDYCFEFKKPEYITSVMISAYNFHSEKFEDIFKKHANSIFSNPDIFFESIKNFSANKYLNEALPGILKSINNVIDLNNLKNQKGQNLANYFENNPTFQNLFRNYAENNPEYKEFFREALISNNISYSSKDSLGFSAFDGFCNYFNLEKDNLSNILLKTDVLTKINISERVISVIDLKILEELKKSDFDFNSPQGNLLSERIFNNEKVSDKVKIFIIFANNELKESEKAQLFIEDLTKKILNKESKDFSDLVDLFIEMDKRKVDLNTFKIFEQTIPEFLISQKKLGNISRLLIDNKLDLTSVSNGTTLFEKLQYCEKNRESLNLFINEGYVQNLIYGKYSNDNLNYLEKLVASDLSLSEKISKLEKLKELGVSFDNTINDLNFTYCIKNSESDKILKFLLNDGYDVFKEGRDRPPYISYMLTYDLSFAFKTCAENDESFIDKLFEKKYSDSKTYSYVSAFDKLVENNFNDSLAYIISGNERMIDNIINSDNPKNLETLKNVIERYPDFLDKLVRNDSFKTLDVFKQVDILVNSGSINKLYREENFETLSHFVLVKPESSIEIKKHLSFEKAPKEFQDKVIEIEKTFNIDSFSDDKEKTKRQELKPEYMEL